MIGTRHRFVLVIGDEGATLCEVKGAKLVGATFAALPDKADQMTVMLAAALKVPVAILVDVLDISLVRETVPPASGREREQILRRRTRQAFPDFDYTGTMALGRANQGRRDHLYLTAGAAPSTGFAAWMAYLDGIANPRGEVALLPIEAMRLLQALREAEDDANSDSWCVLVSRERSGGFRQVIARGDVIQFTRLTQTIDASATPEEVAAAIETEYGHTLDYMKRLGFTPGDGLELVVVIAEAVCRALETRTLVAKHHRYLTPHDVAVMLGFESAVTGDDGYCDTVHGIAFASRNRPLMALRSRVMIARERARKLLASCYFGAAAIAGAAVLYLLAPVSNIYSLRNDMPELEQRRRGAQIDLTALRSEIEALPRPLELMVAELRTWQALGEDNTDLGDLLGRLRNTLGDRAHVAAAEWSLGRHAGDVAPRSSSRTTPDSQRYRQLRVTLDLVGVGNNRASAIALGAEIENEIRAAFDGYTVLIPRLPVPIRPTETLRIDGGLAAPAPDGRAMSMVVLIQGVKVTTADEL